MLSATCHYEIKQFTSPGGTFPVQQCQHKGKTVVLLCLLRVLECTVLFGSITINNIRCRLLLRVYRGLFTCLCVFLCIGGSRNFRGGDFGNPSKQSLLGLHTHPFNGPFSGTTRVSWYQKGKTNLDFTEARQ